MRKPPGRCVRLAGRLAGGLEFAAEWPRAAESGLADMLMAIIGLLCGGLLGLRFRVFVLVPAHLAAAMVLGCVAVAVDWPAWRLVLDMLAWSLACDGGYAAAAVLRLSKRQAGPMRRVLF